MSGITDTIRARARGDYRKAGPVTLPAVVNYEKSRIPDFTLAERQANLYASLSWIQDATAALAQTIAAAKFEVQQRGRDELRAVRNHPFELKLEQPNEYASDFELVRDTVAWLTITGNCYWWLNRAGADVEPDEIWIIPSYQIQPVPDGNMGVAGYEYNPGNDRKIPLEVWEVVHFKTFNPLSRYVGLSLIQALALDSLADLGAQKYAASFYDKGNAKMAGILAFADNIEPGRWQRLQADWREQTGGAQAKRMAMLQNVGAGGVQWISTQLNHAETQFLEQRTFTKEEIYARIAPGLASILAVNATEANSTAGKDTFLSMAVYPLTVYLGKTLTSRLIRPVYGDGFVGTFEDLRRVDTQIELLEQQEYAKTHTIDQINAKYYQDKPLGDERGNLFVAEIGSGPTDTRTPEDKQAAALDIMQQRAAQQPPPGQDNNPDAALVNAGKALDRRRWREKAVKALAAGKGADVAFDPEWLLDGEAMTIRAALKRARTADDVWKAMEI